jgi:hypothetical protein
LDTGQQLSLVGVLVKIKQKMDMQDVPKKLHMANVPVNAIRRSMLKQNKKDPMLVEENQYRAVITKVKGGWSASVQIRVGIDEWKKVRCGLKGVVFPSSANAESKARKKMKEQKSLDKNNLDEVSYIIYDD